MLFVIISLALYLLFMDISTSSFEKITDSTGPSGIFIIKLIQIVLFIFAFIYFIDFVSLGLIKRIKWFSKIYFPFYRFFSWITLAPLYRPIYYNLVDNRFGRRVGLLVIPYSLLALFGSSMVIDHGRFFPPTSDPNYLSALYYADEFPSVKKISLQEFTTPLIPAKYITGDFLELFLPYNGTFDNQALLDLCPDLAPATKERIVLRGAVNLDLSDPLTYSSDSLLNCFSSMHEVYLGDSLLTDLDLMFYQHPIKKVSGLLTVIDISHLPKGKNTVAVKKYGRWTNSNRLETRNNWQEPTIIPFWKTED
jgi:hypothetical protein